MQKGKIPSISNLTGFLLNNGLPSILLTFTILSIHLILIGCKFDISISIQE